MKVLHQFTRRMLLLNKTRTMVTVIAIVLSAAMFTAVTTCVSTLQNYLYRAVVAADGSWHGVQYNVSAEDLAALAERGDVRDYTALEQVGYAMAGSMNVAKPYLMIYGIDDKTAELLPIHITEGRLPENDGEILLPNHLETNGQVEHRLGEVLALEIGSRTTEDGWTMGQSNPYTEEERLNVTGRRSYAVVGFYERPSFENFTAPGYSALTWGSGRGDSHDVYLRMKNPKDIYGFLEESAYGSEVNIDLLRYSGFSNQGNYNRVLYGMAGVLIGLIVIGSVALIYNAFFLAVSERSRQYGVLKTIGATRRQLRGSVLYEAALLSAAGIPAGVGFGILGIYITLLCTSGMFESLHLFEYDVALRLHLSPAAILLGAALCLITILVSAWLPARRAIRRNAIENVRQNAEIRISTRELRSFRWVYKLFGLEGLLADKNFKRSRRRYRTTVASLFISVTLFVSAGSFCAYLTDAVMLTTDTGDYDLSYYCQDEAASQSLRAELENLKNVDEVIGTVSTSRILTFEEDALTEEYQEYLRLYDLSEKQAENQFWIQFFFLNDDAFKSWAERQKLDPEDYFAEPVGIVVNEISYFSAKNQRYQSVRCLSSADQTYSFVAVLEEIDGYYYQDTLLDEEGNAAGYIYENENGDQRSYPPEEVCRQYSGRIGGLAAETPTGNRNQQMMIVYPLSMYDAVMPDDLADRSMAYYMTSDSPAQAEQEVLRLLEDLDLSTLFLSNLADSNLADRALVGVIKVFSYGFVVLMLLISLANVFNTISSNIMLRRRELAMLRSAGLTDRGLKKMMCYECILYGVKGLAFGLIAAAGITLLIYRIVHNQVLTGFYIPWQSVAIAAGSVFLVVFSGMVYAVHKTKKDDILTALTSENI